MIKKITVILLVILGITITSSSLASAANGADFRPGRIIDDTIFYDRNAMDTPQIQRFLESKVPNCDYNGTQSAADWGYPNITHAQFAERKRNGSHGFTQDTGFHAPPYKCLTRYSQATPQMEAASGYCNAISAGNRSAAQIINDVAKACGINPQVLIVLLEKEQSLVTDNWPLNRQLRHATGFACPDTAPCNPAYEGFFYQVYNAARQFKVYQSRPNDYNYVAARTNRIYWNPDLSRCGSSDVYIENQATAALYIYTPYRPNQAALNNMYGTGDSCSSYGNRNFWRIFTDWFGTTRGPAYAWKEKSLKYYQSDERKVAIDYNNIPRGQYFYAEYTVENTGYRTWPRSAVLLGRGSNSDFCTAEWVACSRASVVNKDKDVTPGETATFGFWMKAPNAAGQHRISWNLLIENVSWFVDIGSHQNIKVTTEPLPNNLPTQKGFMKQGDQLYSPDKLSVLSLQVNGELAIFYKTKKVVTLASGVHQLRQQGDGNLVAYNKQGSAVWARGDGMIRNLTLTNNGTLVYKNVSNTNEMPITNWTINNTAQGESLKANHVIFKDQAIASDNGKYRLILQGDGNLVQYGPSGAVWSSNSNGGDYLIQQGDGKLVLYGYRGNPIWASTTWTPDGSKSETYVQGDRNIVTYVNFRPVWALR